MFLLALYSPSSPTRALDLFLPLCGMVQPLLSLCFPKSDTCVGLYSCWLAVGRLHLLSQQASIHQALRASAARSQKGSKSKATFLCKTPEPLLHPPYARLCKSPCRTSTVSHQEHIFPHHCWKEEKARSLRSHYEIQKLLQSNNTHHPSFLHLFINPSSSTLPISFLSVTPMSIYLIHLTPYLLSAWHHLQ